MRRFHKHISVNAILPPSLTVTLPLARVAAELFALGSNNKNDF
jgi:hypothetical protein